MKTGSMRSAHKFSVSSCAAFVSCVDFSTLPSRCTRFGAAYVTPPESDLAYAPPSGLMMTASPNNVAEMRMVIIVHVEECSATPHVRRLPTIHTCLYILKCIMQHNC